MQGSTNEPDRTCGTCGSALAPGQAWCLECGHGQPARSPLPGRRAALTIGGVVCVLALGAAAAAYAAFSETPTQPTTIAAAAPAPAPAVTPTTAASTAPGPVATTATSTATIRSIPPPPAITAPTPVPEPTVLPETTTSTGTTTATTKTTPTTTTTATTKTTTTPKELTPAEKPGLQEVQLGPEAGSVYDPYGAATDQTDPADAYDDKPNTVFTITTAAGHEQMGVGLDIAFDTATEISALQVHTSTPGFTVEVYGTDGGRPADILDDAWKHLTDVSKFGAGDADGKAQITIPTAKYRHIVLWFTTPPTPAGDATDVTTTTTTTTTTTATEPAPVVGISDVEVLD